MYHGFLNIDKPAGVTSTDVVRQIRRAAHQKQVGHGGTLDPMATGVLPIALGNATRLLEYLQEEEGKAYRATVQLGTTTDTDDAEGTIIQQRPVPPLSDDQFEQVLAQFRGTIEQVPPQYAAIRVAGRRMYEYARAGEYVELPSRTIDIEQLTLLDWATPMLVLDVQCSKGTYIRALARDIGAMLNCGAHLTALRRTRAGVFDLQTAVPLETILVASERLSDHLLPLNASLADWPCITVNEEGAQRLRHGQRITTECAADRAAALDERGELVAIIERVEDAWKPVKVMSQH